MAYFKENHRRWYPLTNKLVWRSDPKWVLASGTKRRHSIIFTILQMMTSISGDSVTNGTELISTFMIVRHGDRTPTESSLKYSTDVEALRSAAEIYGYGQLTELGKQRSYQLGKFIRERYDELLSPQYNRSEIYIRSTDTDRTEMTILTAMAAVYPGYPGSWSDEVNWVPTPYTTVPVKYDILMAPRNCPPFRSSTRALLSGDNPRMAQYKPLLDVVSSRIGVNLTATPVMVIVAYGVLITQKNLGICLDEVISDFLPDIKAAADEACDIVYGNDKLKALQAGPLLNEFFIYTSMQISGSSTPPVRVYSAHGGGVYALESVCEVTQQGMTNFAAAFALELRRDEMGQYYVLPVYLPSPGEPLEYLPVNGCSTLLCPYEEFKNIVSPNILNERTWREKCGSTEDLVIDTSGL